MKELLGNVCDFEKAATLLPDQKWVIDLLSEDRNELISAFTNVGKWLEKSFYVTD